MLCALALAAMALSASRLPRSRRRAPGFSFPQKQTLTYSVDWRVFPAGTAVLHFEADWRPRAHHRQRRHHRRHQSALPCGRPISVHLRPRQGLHLRVRQADRRGPPPDQLHAPAGLRPGQIHPGREKYGHRADQASGGAHFRLPDRPADGRLLCRVAAHGRGQELRDPCGGRPCTLCP